MAFKLKPHYCKLLHTLGTFTAMCFLCASLPWSTAVGIAILLQGFKVYRNYKADNLYHPAGDLLANVIGFGLYWLYVGIS